MTNKEQRIKHWVKTLTLISLTKNLNNFVRIYKPCLMSIKLLEMYIATRLTIIIVILIFLLNPNWKQIKR